MRSKYILIALVLVALAFGVGRLSAAVGTVDSLDVPANTLSYTLEDIYSRLDTGAEDGPSAFTEPAAGPGTGTGHTLDRVMGVAPVVDDTNGATTADVLSTKTYWSRRAADWGHQTGTMPDNGAVTIVPTTTNKTIALGYHNGSGEVLGDTDLVSGNIKSGVDIFGVTGTYEGECVGGMYGGSRWCDHGDGTVTDLNTGLMWTKNANLDDDIKTWWEAKDYCDGLTGPVYSDWRLPTKDELDGLVNGTPELRCLCTSGPCNLYPFTGVQSYSYWSSTTGFLLDYAWLVSLLNGDVRTQVKNDHSYVWPVRGGQ